MSADDKRSLTAASAAGLQTASSVDRTLTSVIEFCDTSATELSTESSDTAATSAVTVLLTPTGGASFELSAPLVSRLGSEFTRNSSDLVLRRRGRLDGAGTESGSQDAGDGRPVDEPATRLSTRLIVPLDGDGVDSINYSTHHTLTIIQDGTEMVEM